MSNFCIRRFFIVLIAISACNNRNKTGNISIFTDLEINKWKIDSLGCLNYRSILAEKVIEKKDSLVGKNLAFAIKYLGHPNVEDTMNSKYLYYIEPSRLCEGQHAMKKIEVSVLYIISGGDNKIEKIGIAIP